MKLALMPIDWFTTTMPPAQPMTPKQSAIVCNFIPKALMDEGEFKSMDEVEKFMKDRMVYKGWIIESRSELTTRTAGDVMEYFEHWLDCNFCSDERMELCAKWIKSRE